MKLTLRNRGRSLKVATISFSPWYLLEESAERFETVGLDGSHATLPNPVTTLIDFHDLVWVSFEEVQNEAASKW